MAYLSGGPPKSTAEFLDAQARAAQALGFACLSLGIALGCRRIVRTSAIWLFLIAAPRNIWPRRTRKRRSAAGANTRWEITAKAGITRRCEAARWRARSSAFRRSGVRLEFRLQAAGSRGETGRGSPRGNRLKAGLRTGQPRWRGLGVRLEFRLQAAGSRGETGRGSPRGNRLKAGLRTGQPRWRGLGGCLEFRLQAAGSRAN